MTDQEKDFSSAEEKSLIEFPCQFPIKIIGNKTTDFFDQIVEITRRHFPETPDTAIRTKDSDQGHYLAITVTVLAKNQEGLDAFYQDLTKHPDIKMVL